MASPFVFGNFFETELLDDISTNATTIHVTPTMAARIPIFALGVQEARLVLWDGVNSPEIVGATANPGTGFFTVVRGKEGTSSRPWPAGTQVICSLTAEIINAALQAYFDISGILALNFLAKTGGTLTGPLILAADPTLALGAVTKQYADSVLGAKLPLLGGTMLGTINMNGNRILNIPAAVAVSEPIRKDTFDAANVTQGYINANASGSLATSGTGSAYIVTPTGPVILALTDGISFTARVNVTNAASPNLTYSGASTKAIKLNQTTALPEKYFQQGMPYSFIYDAGIDAWLIGSAFTRNSFPGDTKWSARETDHGNWLLCDQRSLLRTTFSELFTEIGVKFGAVDGTHFNIPPSDGYILVGRGNSLAITQNLTTTAGSTAATVGSNTGLTIGMFIIPTAGNVTVGTKITDINGLNVTLSANALTSATQSTRFSQLSDPNVTGASGGVVSRTQSRREVGQHLHANTVGETAHTHTINQLSGATVMSTAGGSTNFAAGAFGAISAASGISLNTALANVTITNVDSTAPVVMPMLQPSQVMNMFICAY